MYWHRIKRAPYVSIGIVAINIIVYIICTFTGNLLYNMGGLTIWDVQVQGEYWRIVSAMFLHIGTSHIFNNMLILFFMGAMIENEIGHIPFALLYFVSGICGNIFSLVGKATFQDISMSVGASGATFGLTGLLLALVLFSGRQIPNVTIPRVFLMVFYSLYNGFTGYNVDNAAHVGGLLAGFGLGVIACMIHRRKQTQNERCRFEH